MQLHGCVRARRVFIVVVLIACVRSAEAQGLYVSESKSPPGAVSRFSTSAERILLASGFGQPHEIAVDRDGNVYVTEVDGDRIRKIQPDGVVQTVYTFDDPRDNPEGIAIGP